MPIRKGTVSAARFRVQGKVPKDVKSWLTRALKAGAFEPIDPRGDDERTAGFVELQNDRATDFAVGHLFEGLYALFAWRVESLRVPAQAIRTQLSDWSQKFEAKNGRAPGRGQKSEQKALIRKSLRARTEPSSQVFDVSYELPTGELLVWATSRAVIDGVQAALESGLEVRLVPRVPASLVGAAIDSMSPTPELFGEELSRLAKTAEQPHLVAS